MTACTCLAGYQGSAGGPCTAIPPTQPPTADPTNHILVVVTLEIDNLLYSWYVDNVNFFDGIFRQFIATQFNVPVESVTIITVTQGSVIVQFNIIATSSANADQLNTAMTSFITSGSVTSLSQQLPAAAFQDPSQGASIDSTGSSTHVSGGGNPTPVPVNVGAIVGGVVGGVALLALLVGGVVFIILKGKRARGSTPKVDSPSDASVEMID